MVNLRPELCGFTGDRHGWKSTVLKNLTTDYTDGTDKKKIRLLIRVISG
jgi:hypothetical protein